jgi:hypothetical protein
LAEGRCDDMKQGISTIERAFQIARSGTVRSIVELKEALKRESYDVFLIQGRHLMRQLSDTIKAARNNEGEANL